MSWPDDDRVRPGGGRSSGAGASTTCRFGPGLARPVAFAPAALTTTSPASDEYDGEERDPAVYERVGPHAGVGGRRSGGYWEAADCTSARTAACTSAPISRSLATSAARIPDRARPRVRPGPDATRSACPTRSRFTPAGRADGHEHNPHVHLMISERRNDGMARDPSSGSRGPTLSDPAAWRRAEDPHASWPRVGRARARAAGRHDQQDAGAAAGARNASIIAATRGRASTARPATHYGPTAAHRVHRGETHERLDLAVTVATDRDHVEDIDVAIAVLEAERQQLLHETPQKDRRESAPSPGDDEGRAGERDQEWSPSR